MHATHAKLLVTNVVVWAASTKVGLKRDRPFKRKQLDSSFSTLLITINMEVSVKCQAPVCWGLMVVLSSFDDDEATNIKCYQASIEVARASKSIKLLCVWRCRIGDAVSQGNLEYWVLINKMQAWCHINLANNTKAILFSKRPFLVRAWFKARSI